MDIIDAMLVQNRITFIHDCIVGKYMFRKLCKAHRHILFILSNIERRDLIIICFGLPLGETFSALLAICAGNSPGTGEFPAQRPVTRSYDVFFDLCLNKRLGKQS